MVSGIIAFQCDVEIGASKSKGRDSSPSWVAFWLWPIPSLSWHEKRDFTPFNGWIWRFKPCRRRDGVMVKRHDALHDSSNTGCCFQVTNLRFDRTNCNVVAMREAVPQQGKRRQFCCVANFGRGPMRFNQFNGTGLIACLIVSTCDGLDLSSLAWCCDSFASPVRRTTYATNDRMHFITVCDGIA